MKTFAAASLALVVSCVALAAPSTADHRDDRDATLAAATTHRLEEWPRGNQGRLPPAPTKRARGAAPEVEHTAGNRTDDTPHVNQNHWYGHDRPDDPRYMLVTPFLHGHFAHVGPGYRYAVAKVDMDQHLIWLPGDMEFRVADWDWPIWKQWCADCGDDFVIYPDPDHEGWYLLYNVHVAGFVHVEYMGKSPDQ
jgi:hypothetical protein